MRHLIALAAVGIAVSGNATGGELRILAWNVESGTPNSTDHAEGTDPNEIAEQLGEFDGYDLLALTEVPPGAANDYIAACGLGESVAFNGFRSITGGGDRQVIAFNAGRFTLVDGPREVHEHEGLPLNLENSSGNWRFRSPMYVVLRDNPTGIEFIFMVIHLARSNTDEPNSIQSIGLHAWAVDQTLPVIIAGDANYDYEFPSEDARPGLRLLTDDGAVKWVRPDPMVDTNWADRRVGGEVPEDEDDRSDQFEDSVLDFVFAVGTAKNWSPVSDVVVRSSHPSIVIEIHPCGSTPPETIQVVRDVMDAPKPVGRLAAAGAMLARAENKRAAAERARVEAAKQQLLLAEQLAAVDDAQEIASLSRAEADLAWARAEAEQKTLERATASAERIRSEIGVIRDYVATVLTHVRSASQTTGNGPSVAEGGSTRVK
jgi:hypothetical protein